MPIRTPDGYLDITNATLRGSEIITTSKVGIANSAPTHTLSVGNKLFVDDSAANVLTVSGNLVATSLKIGQIDLAPSYGLEHVANVINTVSNVVQFTNTGTGFVSVSNVGIGTSTSPAGLLDVVGAFRMRYQDMGVTKAHIITGANSVSISESGGTYTYTRGGSGNTGNFLPNPSNIVPNVGQRYRVKLTARSDYAGTIRYECPTSTIITTYDLTTTFKEYTWDFTATGTTMQFAVTTVSGTTSQFNAFSIERLGVGFNVNPTSTTAPVQISGVTHFSDNVGIGVASPLQTLHVAGNGENPVIYMSDSSNTRYASGMGTHHVSNEGQRLDFYTGDSGANGTSLGSSHIRMSIKHNGNVGIGTASPQNSLHLFKSGNEQTSGLFIEKQNVGTGTSQITFGVNGSTENVGVAKAGIFFQRASFNGRGDLKFCIDNVNDANSVGVSDAAMTIYRDGNVGIGTESPAAVLDVFSSPHVTGYREMAHFRVSNTSDDSDFTRLIFGQVATNKMFLETTNEANTKGDLLLQPYGGNVGVGTANPNKGNLSVYGLGADPYFTGFNELNYADATDFTGLAHFHSSGSHGVIRISNSADKTGTTRIDFNTTLGAYWGVNTPQSSYFRGTAPTAGRIMVRGEIDNNYEDSFMTFHTCRDLRVDGVGGTGNLYERMRITSEGNVGIGTVSPSSRFVSYGGDLWDGSDHTSKVCATLLVGRGGGSGASTQDPGTGAILEFRHSADYRYVTMESVSEGNYSGHIGLRFKTIDESTGPEERMRIDAHGNVGIGVASPAAKFDVRGASHDPSIPTVHIGDNAADAGDYGMVNLVRHATSGGSKAHLAFIRSGNTVSAMGFHNNTNTLGIWTSFSGVTSTPAISINSAGKVGIGTASPVEKLDVRGNAYLENNSIFMSGYNEGSTNNTVYSQYVGKRYSGRILAGMEIENVRTNSAGTAITTDGAYGQKVHFRAHDYNLYGGNVNDRTMTIAGANVGVGTTTPYAKLHVNGTGNVNIGASERQYFRHGYNSAFGATSASSGYGWGTASIYASHSIASGDFFMSISGAINSSDVRIKKNIVDADDAECLEVLRLLKPKKYQYKDEIKSGTEPVWGFIAQEVRETLPYATKTRQFVLPNIYELANVSSSNVITFTNFNTSNLESNATTLIRTKGIDGEDHDIHLAEVIDAHSIRVEEDMTEWTGSVDETGNVVAGNQLFIYGQEVDDFVFLKKEAIWTVATAALQEVDRQLQAEKTKTTTFETELQAEKTKTSTFETKLQEAEAKIATLQAEKEAIRSDLSSLVLRVTALES